MKIEKYPEFQKELDDMLDYIALDSLQRAIDFKREIHKQISKIIDMPYMHRKSIHFDNEQARDLVFKGYTITYFIYEDKIVILGILKYKETFLIKS
ncbi:type II toxin-antitoxin system RelE/ParE family toxin [Sulfurimonas crateris]|nr:type II toxin-antitoxin system RelE/ParE family toxin [Sulfurimonas crateris]